MMMGSGDSDLAGIIHCLERTLVPDKTQRDGAENELRKSQQENGFSSNLLRIIAINTPNMQSVRLAAAVVLKNFVKKYWPTSETSPDEFIVPESDREMLKQQLVPLMFSCPPFIQKLIGETINIIAWVDFPAQWSNLLPTLIQAFVPPGDTEAILGSLRTCHGLFKHYRGAFASADLYREINFVLDIFVGPFTLLFSNSLNQIATLQQAAQSSANRAEAKENLENLFQIILLCCKIYLSLISQDLPNVFADSLDDWMSKYGMLLQYENNDLKSDNDEEPGVLNNVKSVICAILTLLTDKYDEDFQKYMSTFAGAVWQLLQKTTQLMQDDLLVFNAIEFLSKAMGQYKYRELFSAPETLAVICDQIIVPNIQFRQSDKEIFVDNPDEFIRRDIEGSDTHTRRHAAGDLVRSALKHFEEPVTKLLKDKIEAFIKSFDLNRQQNWKEKDSAVFLFTAVASKGQTARHGITSINPLMAPLLVSFTKFHVCPHFTDQIMTGDQERDDILRADCLKFVVTFRAQLPRDVIAAVLPVVVHHLNSPNQVVYTYAAHCIERIFTTRDLTTGLFAIPPADIQPFIEPLLANLLRPRLLANADALNPEGVLEENEYVMKCIMRTLSYLQIQITPHLDVILQGLLARLRFAIKNPGQPRYDHYLFESLALCIGTGCATKPEAVALFEKFLFPQIELILKDNVDAFFPYVFQLLGQMLEYRTGEIPGEYLALLDFLLKPELLRDYEGCVPCVIRLLSAFFQVNISQLGQRLDTCFGMIKQLLIRRKLDHEGFVLLRPVVDKTPLDRLGIYLPEIFRVIFERLSKSKTDKFVKNLNAFIFFMIVRLGPDFFIEVVEKVQTGIFGMLLDRIILTEVGKISKTSTRRLCIVGGTMLLTETNKLLEGQFDGLWIPLLSKIVELLELPPEKEVVEDIHTFDLSSDDTMSNLPSAATMQNQLVFARKPEKDLVAHLGDLKLYLATQLAKLSTLRPGKVSGKLQACIPQVQTYVSIYCQNAKVHIS